MIKEPINNTQLKSKVIVCDYFLTSNYGWTSLEDRIQKFINLTPMDIIDIQYSSVIVPEDKGFGYCHTSFVQRSAFIIYKEIQP